MKVISFVITCLFATTTSFAQQRPNSIKGRYVMAGSSCAGFDFVDANNVKSYAEIQCDNPGTLKMKWLTANIFTLRDKVQANKDCPPRVYVYQVIKNSSKQLVLKSVWLGWNDYKDEVITYNKK